MLMLINYFIKTQVNESDSLIFRNWVKSSYVFHYLGCSLSSLLRKINPLLHVFLCIGAIGVLLGDTLPPDDSCIIDGSENVEPLASHLLKYLLWPTALVPAVYRKVVQLFIDVALARDHIEELIWQTQFWDDSLELVIEGVLREEVDVFVELGHHEVAEAVWIDTDGIIIVHASLDSCQKPMNDFKRKASLQHVDLIGNSFEVFLLVIKVLIPIDCTLSLSIDGWYWDQCKDCGLKLHFLWLLVS